ncbi:hypothetical protein ASE48_16210 [Mycobacterium sp. Root265]|uniref:YfjI family protein n=1 Tax=Mycobacterium sp. Root265 TaxID=1736504 RepID=UPI0007104C3D|nr:YfjI family protein [Mycobacterium sp. Root265]KRD05717.1 hypothetical protein ASE48_16210 [Mycobacterium sp. Root265]
MTLYDTASSTDAASPAEHGLDDNVAPIPLNSGQAAIPGFPVDAFPGPIAEMVEALAEATQTDPAMAATSALTVLAACVGGRAEIQVRPGWREPLCLYTASIANPGERKSSVQAAMTRPLREYEAVLVERTSAHRDETSTRQKVAVKVAERMLNAAANEGTDAALANAISADNYAKSITIPPVPLIVADDITPEAAVSALADQGGRLAIISAEGGIFDIMAGRYTSIPNMDIWLKGHSGDTVKVDRKGRPAERIPSPALTLGLMIQPAVVEAIASTPGFRGRGLLARFLYAYLTSRVGRREIAPSPVPAKVLDDYSRFITTLIDGTLRRSGTPAVIRLDEFAQAAFTAIERAAEPTLVGKGELAGLADWGAKYAGATARIAGLIHMAKHGHHGSVQQLVDADTVSRAERMAIYYKACAIQVFTEIGADPEVAKAAYLLRRLVELGEEVVDQRDMQRLAQSFKTKAELVSAIECLVQHRHLLRLPAPERARGRPRSPQYLFNRPAA